MLKNAQNGGKNEADQKHGGLGLTLALFVGLWMLAAAKAEGSQA